MLFSEAQYREWEMSNSSRSPVPRVPVPFDPSATIDWTPVWSFTERRHKLLPSMYLYYGYPAETARAVCPADSNGCAAGNTREEAILQGFCELVERDCVALWWYNRARRPTLDLQRLRTAYHRKLRAYYESVGREFWVLDITNDLGIPCFAAISRQLRPTDERIILGFGAHLNVRLALNRALNEMNQMLAVVWTAEREGRRLSPEQEAWLAEGTVAAHPYLTPGGPPSNRIHIAPHVVHRDLRDCVRSCQRIVERLGMEFLVLDQTRPDTNAAVVKVIVPGLRHFRPRFAPGRLYDVPVMLGWLATPHLERQLNAVPLFL
jgi:thiazole/oxazole-forming peptide maturase SagD family component